MRTRSFLGLLVAVVALAVGACGDSDPAPASAIRCTEVDPHPIAEGIARKFDVTYEEVMTWFCGGYSFDDILLALQTAELVDKPAGELLVIKGDSNWDELWESLGLVSPPPSDR